VYLKQFETAFDFPIYKGKPQTFLIANTPRSGSHLLGHSLSETRQHGVPLEYFNPANVVYWYERFGVSTTQELIPFLFKYRTSRNGYFGVKADWGQYKNLCNTIHFDSLNFTKIVWIQRNNLLKQAVSYAIAKQTRQWISAMPKQGEAEYDYSEIVKCARKIRNWNQNWKSHFETTSVPVLQTKYEDIIGNPQQELEKIAKFINPEHKGMIDLTKQTLKQTGKLNHDWISHFRKEMRPRHRWIEN